MPYFVWKGINIQGFVKRGIRFARNEKLLERALLDEEIALLSVRQPGVLGVPRLSHTVAARICTDMSSLLGAGIRLDEALAITSKTVPHTIARTIMHDCVYAVREGTPLSQALSCYLPSVDDLMVALIAAGEEAGALKNVFKMLSDHYTAQERLRKEMRLALIMPVMTLLFFILITLGIFLVVIPRFEMLFTMLNKPMPPLTRALFMTSSFLQSKSIWICGIVCAITAFGVRIWRFEIFKKSRTYVGLWLPLSSSLMRGYALTFFLHTLAFLLEGGVHLVKALSLAQNTVSNEALRNALVGVSREVEAGVPLSVAFSRCSLLRSVELESLFLLGETTGNLAPLVRRSAELYYQHTYRTLTFFTTLIPPLLLVLLGCVVGLLIFAVYTPLLTLSWSVG